MAKLLQAQTEMLSTQLHAVALQSPQLMSWSRLRKDADRQDGLMSRNSAN